MRRGFTLIELVAVLALMGILVTTVMLNVGALEVARLKTDASRLAAAVRYLHNLAVMNNGYYRLVIDVSSGKYAGEEVKPSEKGCAVFVKTDADEEREAKEALKAGKGPAPEEAPASEPEGAPAEGASTGLGAGGEGSGEPPPVATDDGGKKPGAKAAMGGERPKEQLRRKANLLKHLELGKGIHFAGVASQYRKDLVTEGKSTILFFPDGTIERALVYVASDEETWTVVTEPAMGIARVYQEKRDEGVLEIEHD